MLICFVLISFALERFCKRSIIYCVSVASRRNPGLFGGGWKAYLAKTAKRGHCSPSDRMYVVSQ